MATLEDIKAKCRNEIESPDDCWEWGGYMADGLRPQMFTHHKSLQVRRVVYEIAVGAIPPKRVIVPSKCDNRFCVNPAHMAAKSIQQMVRSEAQRGKFKKSEAHRRKIARAMQACKSALTPEAVEEIRGGLPLSEAINKYDISAPSYYQVRNQERWKPENVFAGLFSGLLRPEPEPA